MLKFLLDEELTKSNCVMSVSVAVHLSCGQCVLIIKTIIKRQRNECVAVINVMDSIDHWESVCLHLIIQYIP